ncbi:hypothetical protein FZEAL_1903 [Fusarium zealandicum]|uniref:O-methylsterigmatocystin oxidoreductase n=1 Tax=Fusarium zealandicum TaxID=1053134 RepID=A0A8H4USH8_9HYPO|nr:hypothetical protein FZEAL_1903 [Fusarium zealandicum]
MSSIVLQAITALAVILFYYRFFRKSSSQNLPPGPKPLPLVGNIRDLPSGDVPEYKHWIKFKETYGPISSITVLGSTLVQVHDVQAARELLDHKSTKTSSRPSSDFAIDLCGFGVLLPTITYNSTFRLHRKLIHQQLGTKAIAGRFHEIQDIESRRFLLRVLNDPDNLTTHIKTEASAIILRITYGYCIEPEKADPLVGLIERMMDHFSAAFVPLSWPCDIFPILKHLPDNFPGASFKKTANKWRAVKDLAADTPYSFVENQLASGTSRPSYVGALIESTGRDTKDGRPSKVDEDAIKNTAAIIYGGGADTSVSTLTSFILAMIVFPDVQRKAQEEIDNVIGSARLPVFQDREKLPYVNALLQETLRWMPVVPVGTTHVADEDMSYNGYHIPKGAYLMPAIWWFLHDPQTYPDPEAFEPARYLEPRNEPDPGNHAFGYGRRICPGRYLAEDSLFITISRVLAAFDVRRAVDAQGKEIEVEIAATGGLISHPKKFAYDIKPRSAKHVDMIRSVEIDHPWEESDAGLLKGFP